MLRPQLAVSLDLISHYTLMGSAGPPSWWLTAFSSPSISHLAVIRLLLCSGRGAGQWQASLPNCHPACVTGVCIINKAPLTLECSVWTATGVCSSFWAWPKSHSWKQGESYLCSLNLASSLEAMCNMSLPIYPQFLPGSQPWLIQFSHSPLALLGYHHKQVLFHRAL